MKSAPYLSTEVLAPGRLIGPPRVTSTWARVRLKPSSSSMPSTSELTFSQPASVTTSVRWDPLRS